MEVIWTKLAKITYFEIIENLSTYWSKKEIINFKDLTNSFISNIETGIIKHQIVTRNNIRKCIIHKNVTLFYKEDIKNKKIILITFFNNRMSPKILIKLLK